MAVLDRETTTEVRVEVRDGTYGEAVAAVELVDDGSELDRLGTRAQDKQNGFHRTHSVAPPRRPTRSVLAVAKLDSA